MKYCPDCGAELVKKASFCQECGTEIKIEHKEGESENSEGNILQTEEEIKQAARDAVEEYNMTREHITEEMVMHYFLMQQIVRKEAEEQVEKDLNTEIT